ncbi:MAG: helix-hairpin-helix domain-containing protein [Propionibacteriaceae bacterium]|nr:helix-hairpin-helix domain-containing protein [Propionibacteriaceae bacterium]
MNTPINDSYAIRDRLAPLFEQPARRFVGEQSEQTSLFQAGFTSELNDASDLHLTAVSAGSTPQNFQPSRAGVAKIAENAWAFTKSHLVGVGTVLLAGCLWAGYSISQAQSVEVPVGTPTVVATPIAIPTPTPTPTPEIAVHVIGAVKSPGVVKVKQGSRVSDVIQAAGGLAANGDLAELNLAALVVDGSQIVVGTTDSPRGEIRYSSAGGQAVGGNEVKVSLNAATAAQLETLPGIGPVTAARIVAWREANQRFSELEELQEVSGIGPKTYAALLQYLQL